MPSQADLAEVSALVLAQAADRQRLAAQIATLATSSASGFTGWYDSAQIAQWAATVAGRVEPAQRVLARSTDVYMARILTLLAGKRVRPTGAVDVTGLRRGVTHAGAYARAADVYRWQQSRLDQAARQLLVSVPDAPPDLELPVDAAVTRLAAVADMDTQLAVQAQSAQNVRYAAAQGVATGFRRVIHPEMSKGGSCGLCVAASDRLYHVEDLMPLHAQCKCQPLPVTEFDDPGSRLNRQDLRALYKQAGSTGRADLAAVRYQVDEHGELGPLLAPAGAPVRTARQTRRDRPRRELTAAERRQQLSGMRDDLTPAADKARQIAQDNPAWDRFASWLDGRVQQLDDDLAA